MAELSADARERQAALLTVYHHTGRIVLPNLLPRGPLRLPGLRRAARLLHGDADPDKRHAAARVLGRAAALGRERGSVRTHYFEARRDLVLDPDERKTCERNSSRLRFSTSAFGPKSFRNANEVKRLEPPENIERGACRCCLLAAHRLGIDADKFPVTAHDHDAWMDLDSLVTTVVIRLRLAAFKKIDWLDEFAQTTDPEAWTQSEFFTGSYAVKTRDDGKRGWSGQLHEKAQWSMNNGAGCSFDNILEIDFRRKPGTATLKFSLVETESSEVAGWSEAGGLDVDDGYVLVSATGPDTFVEAVKKIRFSERQGPSIPGGGNAGEIMNFMAPALVGLWMDAIVYNTAIKALERRLGQ
jgi:hypothetical protein